MTRNPNNGAWYERTGEAAYAIPSCNMQPGCRLLVMVSAGTWDQGTLVPIKRRMSDAFTSLTLVSHRTWSLNQTRRGATTFLTAFYW